MYAPMCLQTMRNTLLGYLDSYAESVCSDCGYIHRECLCHLPDAGLYNSRSGPLLFLGHVISHKDQSVQTDMPTVLTTMQVKANTQPGISVLLPPGLQLQPGMRFPVTLAQTPCGSGVGQMVNSPVMYSPSASTNSVCSNMPAQNIDASWEANYISMSAGGQTNALAPMSFPLGQQAFVTPMIPSSDTVFTDTKISSSIGKVGLESNSLASQSVLLSSMTPGFSYVRSPTVNLLTGSGNLDGSSRKRKFEGERPLEGLADVGVQTTAKSFIKKLKLRLGKISNNDNKATDKAGTGLSDDNASTNISGNLSVSAADTDKHSMTLPPNSPAVPTPAAAVGALAVSKKDEKSETVHEKKFTTVWKLIEIASDDEDDIRNEAAETNSGTKESGTSTVPLDGAAYSTAVRTCQEDTDVAESLIRLSGQNDLTENGLDSQQNTKLEVKACSPANSSGLDNICSTVDSKVIREAGGSMLMDSHADSNLNPLTNARHLSADLEHNSSSDPVDDPDSLIIDESVPAGTSLKLPESEVAWAKRNGVMSKMTAQNDEALKFEAASERTKDDKWIEATDSSGNIPTKPLFGDRNQPCQEKNDIVLENKPEGLSVKADSIEGSVEADKSDLPLSGRSVCSAVKRKKVYGRFEYTPTGEHILRCLVSKCSQTFDTKMAAELHNAVHPGMGSAPDVVGAGGDVLTYFQCSVCDFRAPYYHWYDLLRHMSTKHGLRMQDKSYSFTCEYCGLGFDSEEKLALHVDFHYSNRYKCVYCGLLLLTWSQVDLLLFLFLIVVLTHCCCNLV
jgi:hypothetical protein